MRCARVCASLVVGLVLCSRLQERQLVHSSPPMPSHRQQLPARIKASTSSEAICGGNATRCAKRRSGPVRGTPFDWHEDLVKTGCSAHCGGMFHACHKGCGFHVAIAKTGTRVMNAVLMGWVAGEIHIRPDGEHPAVREPIAAPPACGANASCLRQIGPFTEDPIELPSFHCIYRWKSVSMIRDPVARIVSEYTFVPGRQETLAEWVGHPYSHNWQLAVLSGLRWARTYGQSPIRRFVTPSVAHLRLVEQHMRQGHLKLGVFEVYHDSVLCILRWLGLSEQAVQQGVASVAGYHSMNQMLTRRTDRSYSGKSTRTMSAAELERLNSSHALDFELRALALDRFRSDCLRAAGL